MDVLRILLSESPIHEGDEDKPGVIIDHDREGNLDWLGVVDASSRISDPRALDYAAKG